MAAPKNPSRRKAANPAKTLEDLRWERIATLRPPTKAEQAAIEEAQGRRAKRPARPEVTIEKAAERKVEVWPAHSDGSGWGDHLSDAFGTRSQPFVQASLERIERVLRERGSREHTSEVSTNGALALMAAIAPANELEAVEGEQIVVSHELSMELMAKARHADTLELLNAYTNLATKVSRTMAVHIETLGRLRSGGKQQVVVKHVYVQGNAVVGDGAQAVFGEVGGGATDRIGAQSHAAAAIAHDPAAICPEVWSEDPERRALPIASGARPEALQNARGHEPRSPEGDGERPLHVRPLDAGTAGSPTAGPGDAEGDADQ